MMDLLTRVEKKLACPTLLLTEKEYKDFGCAECCKISHGFQTDKRVDSLKCFKKFREDILK